MLAYELVREVAARLTTQCNSAFTGKFSLIKSDGLLINMLWASFCPLPGRISSIVFHPKRDFSCPDMDFFCSAMALPDFYFRYNQVARLLCLGLRGSAFFS